MVSKNVSKESESVSERLPQWWSLECTMLWELMEPLLKAEFERTSAARYRRELSTLGVDQKTSHAIGNPVAPRNIDVDRANRVPDLDWELGAEWGQIRCALRFGAGARAKYPSTRWTEDLEAKLEPAFAGVYGPTAWNKLRPAVRRGFEFRYR